MSARETLELEQELKQLLVEVLVLEEVSAADIDSESPLFGEGLGLDSIDSLDLVMVLEQRYGVHTAVDVDRQHFASVRSLATYVAERRTK